MIKTARRYCIIDEDGQMYYKYGECDHIEAGVYLSARGAKTAMNRIIKQYKQEMEALQKLIAIGLPLDDWNQSRYDRTKTILSKKLRVAEAILEIRV